VEVYAEAGNIKMLWADRPIIAIAYAKKTGKENSNQSILRVVLAVDDPQ